MCYGWWEEALLMERIKLAKQKSDELKRSTETLVPARKPEQEKKPERQTETQPDPVPV